VSLLHSACGPSSPDACATGNDSAEDADIPSLLGMLASVTDPRSGHAIPDTLRTVSCSPRASNASITASIRPGRQSRLAGPEVRPHLTPAPAPSRSKSAPTPLGVRTRSHRCHGGEGRQPGKPLAAAWWLATEPQVRPRSRHGRGRGLVYQRARALLCADRCPSCGRALAQ
jgi:hypothetical protein